MTGQPGCPCSICEADGLRERIVLAVLEALKDGDPVVRIAVGNNELRVSRD